MLPVTAIVAPILAQIGHSVNQNNPSPKPAIGPINPVFIDVMESFSSSGVFTSSAAIKPKSRGASVACVLKNSRCLLIARSFASTGASL